MVYKELSRINPILFIDLKKTKESRSHLSLFNPGEIDCIMTLIRSLVYKVGTDYNGVSHIKGQIAVITPYRG
jgi:hypothetical protein